MKTLKELKISPKKIELFNKINIFNSEDLLNYYKPSHEEHKGIVFDCTDWWLKNMLTDFFEYKWNIPVWYSLQLKRDGSFRFEDITNYKLDLGE